MPLVSKVLPLLVETVVGTWINLQEDFIGSLY
jgi:hypothetical protein